MSMPAGRREGGPLAQRRESAVLFDTHAHLEDAKFDEDREQVIVRLTEAGVSRLMLVGDGARDPSLTLELARRHPFMACAVGVHPHDAKDYDEAREALLRGWLAQPQVKALGEIGLDYHYDLSPRQAQRAAFDRQLELAMELGLPVILHVREAHGEATELLRARARAGRLPSGVMHCYTGSWESAKGYLDMGLMISFSGSVTFKNAAKVWEVAQKAPVDRILVETDCPYMAPVPLRGRRNEPAFVGYTAARVAELRGMDPEELGGRTLQNGLEVFGLSGDAGLQE